MQLVYDESRGKMECVGGVTETDPPAILFSVVVVSEQGWRTPRCRGQWPQACVPYVLCCRKAGRVSTSRRKRDRKELWSGDGGLTSRRHGGVRWK